MRIEQSQVALSSRRFAATVDATRSSMEAWVGDRPARATATTTAASLATALDAGKAAIARLSAEARLAAQGARQAAPHVVSTAETVGPQNAPDLTDPTTTDPQLTLLILLVERLTGRKVHLIRLDNVPSDIEAAAQKAGDQAAAATAAAQSAGAQPQRAGWGVEVQVEQVHQETETTGFTATGQVVTADGRTISFDFQVGMHRELTQTSTTDIQAGDAVKKVDPIALNLSDGPVGLSPTRSSFDLDSNGAPEQIALPAAGTYFLALDRNGNGTIDDGGELFGPTTGNGFAELRSLDTDGNGWIDGGDAAYGNLALWSGPNGGLTPLAGAGVGALYVGQSAGTQFDLTSDANETLGQVVSSSVYLGDNGQPGVIAQVDLTA